MMKKLMLALAAPMCMLAQPVAAQDGGDNPLAMLADAFPVDPLTAEQEARLPAARAIMDLVLPEGAMREMMDGMFDGMLGPIMEMAVDDPTMMLNEQLGYAIDTDAMDAAAAREAMMIIDPAWEDRQDAVAAASERMMSEMADRMEPAMRNVMAELYAIRFTEAQLADIGAFFATDTGEVFARQSYAMASDPRIMAAMFTDPDLVFGAMGTLIAEMEDMAAQLPAPRTYADLTPAQRARLAQLTGIDKDDLQAAMESNVSTSAP